MSTASSAWTKSRRIGCARVSGKRSPGIAETQIPKYIGLLDDLKLEVQTPVTAREAGSNVTRNWSPLHGRDGRACRSRGSGVAAIAQLRISWMSCCEPRGGQRGPAGGVFRRNARNSRRSAASRTLLRVSAAIRRSVERRATRPRRIADGRLARQFRGVARSEGVNGSSDSWRSFGNGRHRSNSKQLCWR